MHHRSLRTGLCALALATAAAGCARDLPIDAYDPAPRGAELPRPSRTVAVAELGRSPFVAPSPDGRMVALWSSPDHTVGVIDVATGARRATLDVPADFIGDVAIHWSPDGRRLVIAGVRRDLDADRSRPYAARVDLDAATPTLADLELGLDAMHLGWGAREAIISDGDHVARLDPRSLAVNDVAPLDDGASVVVAPDASALVLTRREGETARAAMTDAETLDPRAPLERLGDRAPVAALRGGRWILSDTFDGVHAAVWSVATGRVSAIVPNGKPIADGDVALFPRGDGAIDLVRLDTGARVRLAVPDLDGARWGIAGGRLFALTDGALTSWDLAALGALAAPVPEPIATPPLPLAMGCRVAWSGTWPNWIDRSDPRPAALVACEGATTDPRASGLWIDYGAGYQPPSRAAGR